MSAREVIALGTSSQVPTRYRNHNGYLLRWDEHGLLFDPGEGTQRQMIYAEVTVTQVTKICVTHFHGDHCLGLAGISQRISLDRVPHEVECYFPRSGRKYYDRLRKASIYHDVSKFKPCPIDGPGEVWRDEGLSLRVARLDHGPETFGYRLQEDDGRTMLPDRLREAGVHGPMIRDLIRDGSIDVDGKTVLLDDVSVHKRGQSFAFVMDTRMCDGAFELAEDVDLLVIESTYLSTEEREARDHGHLTARQAATIAKESGAKRLVLTHFSQRYGSLKPFLKEARELHDDVIAVRDGDRVPVPKRVKPTS